jgi:DNA-binding NtrC family response regulator
MLSAPLATPEPPFASNRMSREHDALGGRLAQRVVLVADDSEAVRTAFDVLFSLHGLRVLEAKDPDEALAAVRAGQPDLIIQDMNFRRDATSGEEGIALFRKIRALEPDMPIVLLTAWTHLETAVELVKEGAADYLAKPWDDTRLLTTIANLLDLRAAREENLGLRTRRAEARGRLAERFDLRGVVYESEAMHTLVSMATQIAAADIACLITGPNGAGKEVIADLVQANSTRRAKSYVKVNAGALPDDLLEAELFGTELGAYTGAKARTGRFEAADGGTLFLDEIANLSPTGQAKLLRVVQTGSFERLGSNEPRAVDVRIIAATNADLPLAIREGRFREDLYYRLNVIELAVPALADRPEDVLALAREFLRGRAQLMAEAERSLVRYPWPGNVRELRNVIERAVLLAEGKAIASHDLRLPAASVRSSDEMVLDRATLEAALVKAKGVVAQAARELGVSRQGLYRRMEKWGIRETPGAKSE